MTSGESRKMATMDSEIAHLVKRIVEETKPLRIIIFGSAARGEAGADSDVDILVVVSEGTHRRRTAQRLYREIRGTKVPFDILVATPGDLEKYGESRGLVYHAALRDGNVVYAA